MTYLFFPLHCVNINKYASTQNNVFISDSLKLRLIMYLIRAKLSSLYILISFDTSWPLNNPLL